jgi:hypothetical protein
MLICRVMVGIYNTNEYLEKSNWSVPLMNPQLPGKRLDGITDMMNDQQRWMFAVFKNEQSYPQWEIKFTK